jgi:hypothetical protein
MFLFYIFVSPLFRFGPNFRVQNEDIAFGLGPDRHEIANNIVDSCIQ